VFGDPGEARRGGLESGCGGVNVGSARDAECLRPPGGGVAQHIGSDIDAHRRTVPRRARPGPGCETTGGRLGGAADQVSRVALAFGRAPTADT